MGEHPEPGQEYILRFGAGEIRLGQLAGRRDWWLYAGGDDGPVRPLARLRRPAARALLALYAGEESDGDG